MSKEERKKYQGVEEIAIDKLRENPKNKQFFSDITGFDFDDLKRSIKERGIIEPLIVRPENKEVKKSKNKGKNSEKACNNKKSDSFDEQKKAALGADCSDDNLKRGNEFRERNKKVEYYRVICGSQRLRVAKEIGLKKLPCIVRKNLSDEEEIIMLVEDNVRRRQLSPMEKVKIISKLYRMYGAKRGRPRKEGNASNNNKSKKNEWAKDSEKNNSEVTSELFNEENQRKQLREIAKTMNLTERQIRKYKSVGEKLIPEFVDLLYKGNISIEIAHALSQLEPEKQIAFYELVKARTTKDVKKKLENLIKENKKLKKEVEEKIKETLCLREKQSPIQTNDLRGIVYDERVSNDRIAMHIIMANVHIVQAYRECAMREKDPHDFGLANKPIKLERGWLYSVPPPIEPLFMVLESRVLELFTQQPNERKYQRKIDKNLLRFLRLPIDDI